MSRELRRQSLLGIRGSSQYNTGLLNLDQKLTQRWILTDQLRMKNKKDLENSKAVVVVTYREGTNLDFSGQLRAVQGRHEESENGKSCTGGA